MKTKEVATIGLMISGMFLNLGMLIVLLLMSSVFGMSGVFCALGWQALVICIVFPIGFIRDTSTGFVPRFLAGLSGLVQGLNQIAGWAICLGIPGYHLYNWIF